MKIEINPNLFRSLDIRGATPEFVRSQNIQAGSLREESAFSCELTAEIAEIIGKAIAEAEQPKKVVVGYDARTSSPELSVAIAKGLLSQGVDVDMIGMTTTDKLYFAIGNYKYDLGVMTTGSHTRKELNGFKISRFDGNRVLPVAMGSGMEKIKDLSLSQDFKALGEGTKSERNIDHDFDNFILNIISKDNLAEAKIIFDAGNGPAGKNYENIIDSLQIQSEKLFFQPDGNFPNHEPNPMIKENLRELSTKIKSDNADFGVAWDGDADRVSFVKNDGTILTGSSIAPLIVEWAAKRHDNLKVVITPPMSLATREMAEKLGVKTILSKVGNSNIKIAMMENDAQLGTEEANHFMFEETFYVESGILPVLAVLQLMKDKDMSFDQLVFEAVGGRSISGDINFEVRDAEKVVKGLSEHYENIGAKIDMLDGISAEFGDWHFCVRPSLNDPVVRLNLEAKSESEMNKKIEEIKKLIVRFDK